MEKNNRCVVIELNGLPGSGKSTISRDLIKELKLKDKVVLSEVDIFKQTKSSKKLLELVKSLYDPKSIKFNYALLKLGIKASLKGKSLKNLKNSIKIIRYNFILKDPIRRCDFDFICLSEGFIQFIYCIYDGIEFFESSELDTILKEINKLNKNLLIVNCNISKEDALERLKERKTIPNSIDLMEEKERIIFIEQREINMIKIRNICEALLESIELDTGKEVKENILALLGKSTIN